MPKLIILQILSHIVSDFYLQTDKSCKNKAEKGFCSVSLYVHTLITFVLSWAFSLIYPYTFDFWWAAILIAVLHGLIDGLKSVFKRVPWAFFIDQLLHLVVIVSVCCLFDRAVCYKVPPQDCGDFCPILNWLSMPTLLWITAFLFCLRPANLFIKEIVSNARIAIPETGGADANSQEVSESKGAAVSHELPNAGRVIGDVERVLTLIFMIFGHFEAIGFLLAAKSLLRFKEEDSVKSEYVLVGTLLSFGMAIVAGALVLLVMRMI